MAPKALARAHDMTPNAMFMSIVTLAALCIVWALSHWYLKVRGR